jgi:hypothetical protein
VRYEVDAILLAPYRAVYVETPKVACTSIKTALAEILGISLRSTGGDPHCVEWPTAERSSIDLQKRNWKFEAGFHEPMGVPLPVPLPNNSRGGYTRGH